MTQSADTESNKRKIFTVARLNQEVQSLLESGFGVIWLQGELSNFSKPASGHFYFSLKDSQAQIRCAMFRGRNRYVDFKPENGDEVLVRGKLGLYAARGDFQLIVEHMEPAGAGKLQQAFEESKRKLDALGWFDQALKKPLPPMPQRIGVVTSSTGAAIRDVLQVLSRRYPQAHIIIYPTLVQGASAAPAIVSAMETANRRNEADVLLLVRGGGSLEDLWAFNDEQVARAIRDSELPVVSGVGHEVDVTISDLVADVRAPTPSAAAELATPDGIKLLQRAEELGQSLVRQFGSRLATWRSKIDSHEQRLHARHPSRQINERWQRVDELQQRLTQSTTRVQAGKRIQLEAAQRHLLQQSPEKLVTALQSLLDGLHLRCRNSMKIRLNDASTRLQISARALDTVSPLATLQRGFAVVRCGETVVRNAAELDVGDKISTQVASGRIHSIVEKLDTD